jgi:hypothetical protein
LEGKKDMNSSIRMLASVSALAVAASVASPAMAAGTASGTTITNTVNVDFRVGGVNQNQVSASDTFTVDRKINLTVAEVGSTTTSVSPGQASAVTAFTVTNASNATLDLGLAATQLSGGTAAHGGTDNFDVTGVGVFVDTNTNGAYDVGTDLAVTYLDQIIADASRTVFVVAKRTARAARPTTSPASASPPRRTKRPRRLAGCARHPDGWRQHRRRRHGFAGHQCERQHRARRYPFRCRRLHSAGCLAVGDQDQPDHQRSVQQHDQSEDDSGCGGRILRRGDQCRGQRHGHQHRRLGYPCRHHDVRFGFGILVNGTVTSGTCNADGTAGGSHVSGVVSGTLSDITAGVTGRSCSA